MRKMTSKVNAIIMLADAPMMGANGSSTAAIRLFEAQIISGLLLNCKSWLGITDRQIAELQGFQDKFLRKLIHLPISTHKAILHWDGGMEMMKWRIEKQKLLFLGKLMFKEDSNICKRAIMNETLLGAEGLGHECKVLSATIGLPDLRYNQVSKEDIKKAIIEHSSAITKEEVKASRKVRDRATVDLKHRAYLSYMTLPNSRIWMRVRARSIKGVKVNNKIIFLVGPVMTTQRSRRNT